jgi:hypothetical protein
MAWWYQWRRNGMAENGMAGANENSMAKSGSVMAKAASMAWHHQRKSGSK